MTAIYRPVEGGYTLVILDEEQVPLPDQDTDRIHPSKRAARKAARRLIKRHRELQQLEAAEWDTEEL